MKIAFITLVLLGLACLVLGVWSLVDGEVRSAVLGIFLAAVLFYHARRQLPQSKRGV